jgi:hypothetical protein
MIGSPSPAPGARRHSLLAMRWALINLEKARWVIPAMWSKDSDEMQARSVRGGMDDASLIIN